MLRFDRIIEAAKEVNVKRGRQRINEAEYEEVETTKIVNYQIAAEKWYVNPREVARMRVILNSIPELFQAVKDDIISLSDTDYLVQLEPEKQLEILRDICQNKPKYLRVILARMPKKSGSPE